MLIKFAVINYIHHIMHSKLQLAADQKFGEKKKKREREREREREKFKENHWNNVTHTF